MQQRLSTNKKNNVLHTSDMVFEISKNLPVKEITTFAKVSSYLYNVSNQEILWKKLLIRDFHFTEDASKLLQARLKFTFKQTYQYCHHYVFNSNQQDALKKLKSYGLTKEYLAGRDAFNHPYHVLALEHLLKSKKIDLLSALQEIEGLTLLQVDGIRYDVPKEELLPLQTLNQIYTITRCYDVGIRAKHLLNLNVLKDFTFLAADTMSMLIKKMKPSKETFDDVILTWIRDLSVLTVHQNSLVWNSNGSYMPCSVRELTKDQCNTIGLLLENHITININDFLSREWSKNEECTTLFLHLMINKKKSEEVSLLFLDSHYGEDSSSILLPALRASLR